MVTPGCALPEEHDNGRQRDLPVKAREPAGVMNCGWWLGNGGVPFQVVWRE
jgi:hypothetical protein